MEALRIRGGTRLEGTVKASGAKNAITKMLVASLICDKKCIFTNVPNIEEVDTTLHLLEQLGMVYTWDKEVGRLEVQTKHLTSLDVTQRFSGANRIPILLLGALLGRTNEPITVPIVGGCKIGKRPIDFHIQALEHLGASFELIDNGDTKLYKAHAPKGLHGTKITLPFPSVGATENAMFAAIRAKGRTIIENAAIEPEVIDIIHFLQKLGVRITVSKDRTITIKESSLFYAVSHHVITDRIETASLAMAAISTKGSVFIEGAQQESLTGFLFLLREIGAHFTVKENGIFFSYIGPLKGGIHIETDVHPGFLTDWQQPVTVLLTQLDGHSIVHETLYENRFGYTETLRSMGADLQLFTECLGPTKCRFNGHNFKHSVSVKGPTSLKGRMISIPDLRAGFAYIMAALIAEDESLITNLHYLDRGYENLDMKLQQLGADITRIPLEDPAVAQLRALLERKDPVLSK